MKTLAAAAAAVALILAAGTASAETYRLAWDPVTKYSDGTAVEAGKTVSYTAYWTTDPSLSPSSLRPIVNNLAATEIPFEPLAAGMNRGQTVYFTCRSSLATGEVSELAAGLSWVVPARKPSSPGSAKIIKIR